MDAYGVSMTNLSHRRLSSSGFTLIELMVVVVLVAIVAVVAVPSYRASVKKTYRRSAQATLMQEMQLQQQYLADQRTYAANNTALNFSPSPDIGSMYNFTYSNVSNGPPPTVTAVATPKSGSGQSGDVTLSIDNLGNKSPSGYW